MADELNLNINIRGAQQGASDLQRLGGAMQGLPLGNVLGGLTKMTGGLGMMATAATGVGAALVGFEILKNISKWLEDAAFKFAKSISDASSAEEAHKASLNALIGDVKKAGIAYEEYDKRVRDSSLKAETFNIEGYATAVNNNLGPAYLNASAAFNGTSMNADSFIKQLGKMEEGQAPMARTMLSYIGVLRQAGLSLDDVTKKTADHKKNAELLKATLEVMAKRQEEAASKTIPGMINAITNAWRETKEELGKVLNEGIIPIISNVKAMLIEFFKSRDLKKLFEDLRDILVENKDSLVLMGKSMIQMIETTVKMTTTIIEFGKETGLLKGIIDTVTLGFITFSNVLKNAKTVLEGLVWLAEKYWEIQTLGAHKARSWEEITGGGPKSLEREERKGVNIEELAADLAGGATHAQATLDWGATPEDIAAAEELNRSKRSGGGGKGKEEKGPTEKEKLAMRQTLGLEPGAEVTGTPSLMYRKAGAIYEEGQKQEEIKAAMESPAGIAQANLPSKEEVIKGQEDKARKIFDKMMGPGISEGMSNAIMEGLKSGNLRKAIEDFGIMFGEEVAKQLLSKLIMKGIMVILDALTGGTAGGVLKVFTAQRGMYTGSYEGPVFVHKNEVIAPLDTISAMTTLVNRHMVKNAVGGKGNAGGVGTEIRIDPIASDLVSMRVNEKATKGSKLNNSFVGRSI